MCFLSLTHTQLVFPRNATSEGSELTKELFRWDQRIFTVLLQLPGLPGSVIGNTSEVEKEGEKDPVYLYLSALCEYTGGQHLYYIMTAIVIYTNLLLLFI